MWTFRRQLRYPSALCLSFLLCAAYLTNAHARASELLPMPSPAAQLKPDLADEDQKLWAEILKNARIETGPRMKNPAIAKDGLAAGIVRALQQQRKYLEVHEGDASRRTAGAAINASTRQLVGNSRNSPSPYQDPNSTCRQPMIRSVNGRTKGVVFTPTAADNRYTIDGCFFGDVPGKVQLEARPAATGAKAIPTIRMQLESISSWSNHQIHVQLDAHLRGISDYPVTLVIYSSKGRRIELHGCRLVAERGHPQLLTMIPSTWVSLYPSGVGPRSIRQLEYVSPTQAIVNIADDNVTNDNVPPNVTASSAFVIRSDPERIGIGKDSYDFSQLNPGWVVEAVQLQTYSISCPNVITSGQSLGRWGTEWTPLGLRVAFQESLCTASVPPSFAFHMSLSQYAIRVWVVGPVGTQPLSLVR